MLRHTTHSGGLEMTSNEIILETQVEHDTYTEIAEKMFDIPLEDRMRTTIINNIRPPEDWSIGCIYGQSGAGKTTLLKTFGDIYTHNWHGTKSIISSVGSIGLGPEESASILSAVGLSSVPSWCRPFHTLSNGEQFRANLAAAVAHGQVNGGVILIDEFTSVVDRNVAKAASSALQKFIRKSEAKVIVASCHDDILDWLNADWVYNPLEGKTVINETRGWSFYRPKIELKIFRAEYQAWDLFKKHHYLTEDLNAAARIFVATWEDKPVAISCTLPFPNGGIQNGWRASRTVVLPDYQGLGIGVQLSDFIASMVLGGGGRYFSRHAHFAFAKHRFNNPNWKETAVSRKVHTHSGNEEWGWKQNTRECYSFEYIGEAAPAEIAELFWGWKVDAGGVEWI